MKKYLAVAGVMILVAVLSGVALAAEVSKEPRGFRNIRWGQRFDTLPNKDSFVLIAQDKNQRYYTKKQDVMTLDGVELDSVRYIFLGDRFIGARVDALGGDAASRLLLFLQGRYGEGRQPIAGGDNYEWDFSDVKLVYNYDQNADKTTLSWTTTGIADKIE